MKNKVSILILIVLVFILVAAVFLWQKEGDQATTMPITDTPKQVEQTKLPPKTPIVGGDRDAHGCIGSAGYSWCEIKNKCLRVWEEKCQ